MRKINLITIAALISSAAVILSCAKEQDFEKTPSEEGVQFHDVQIIANNAVPEEAAPATASRTYLADDGASGYFSKWDTDDQIGLFQKNSVDGYRTKVTSKVADLTLTNSDRTASFAVTLAEVDGAANYKYWAVYPQNAATRSSDDLELIIPQTQTFKAGKFDKAADVMVSEPVERATYSSDALVMGFARVGTIVKMTLKGLTAGETLKSVTFSTSETGKYFAGTVKYDLVNDVLKSGISSGKQSLTLDAGESIVVPASGEVDVWFRAAEVTLSDNFTVVAYTRGSDSRNYSYTKVVNLASLSKTLAFRSGKLATFGVTSMGSGKVTLDYESLIPEGYYVIHYSDGVSTDKALSNTCAGSGFLDALDNPFSDDGNGRYNVSAANLKFLWELVFDDENNKYAFYSPLSGKYMNGDLNNTSGSAVYYYMGANSGEYTGTHSIYDGSTFGSAKHIGYNYNNGTNPRFKFYAAPLGNYPGYLTFTPAYASPYVTYSNINLATSDEISDKVTVNPTKFNFTTSISKVGVYSDSGMTVSTDWLTVTVENASTGELSYTAESNEDDEARTAYVKLTASGENETSATVSFSVKQPEKGGSGIVYWTMITNKNDIDAGDQIIILNEANTVALSAQNGNQRDTTKINKILDTENHRMDNADVEKNSKIQILTVGGASGAWTFYTGSAYLQQPSNNNYLTTNATATADAQKWDLNSVNSTTGVAVVKSKRNTSYTIQYNSSTGKFATYSSSQTAIQIYRKDVPRTAVTPTITPGTGTYYKNQSVTIATSTAGATIYYTTDGSIPNTSSSVYSSAIPVSSTTTIKAYAVKDGYVDSDVASATLTFAAPTKLATPTNLTCSAQTGSTLTFTWDAVSNANGYIISTDGGDTWSSKQDARTYTWTGLSNSTTYTIKVKANASDDGHYTESDAASANGTTTTGQTEYTYIFTAASWTATLGGSAANWTSGKAGGGFLNDGIQVTTTYTGANATSPSSFTNVTRVVCTYNTNKSAGAGSIAAKIGTNSETSNTVGYSGSGDGRTAEFTTTFTYATPQTGSLKLTVNTTTNSIYLVSVTITAD